jgi:hypothetical protein
VKGDDMRIGEQSMEFHGDMLTIPCVAAKTEDEGIIAWMPRREMDPVEPHTSRRFDFKLSGARWQRTRRRYSIGRKQHLALKEIHHHQHCGHDGQRCEKQLGGNSDPPNWRMPLQ